MTFFIDANVIVYAVTDSPYREPCLSILDAIVQRGAPGVTSTAVLEEVWHLEMSGRVPGLAGTTARAYAVLAPLLPVTDEAFQAALSVSAPGLGSNDRLHVGTCFVHGIDRVLSADEGFDRVTGIRRVDPLDGRAIRGLLRVG